MLDDPALIQAELDRRQEAAKKADPLRKREESLRREQVRIEKNIDRLSNGVSGRPGDVGTTAPSHAGAAQAGTGGPVRTTFAGRGGRRSIQVSAPGGNAGSVSERLRARADSLDVGQRQKILRLLVKEILVGKETITIRHSIPDSALRGQGRTGPRDRLLCRRLRLPAQVIFCVRGVISPLLANIYLHLLDRLWAAECGWLGQLIRYADDFVVMTPTEWQAKEALRQIQLVMNKLGLMLHPEKTRMVDLRRGKGSFVFLGCTIRKKRSILRNPRGILCTAGRRLRPGSGFGTASRDHQQRQAGKIVKQIIAKLNPVLRGWGNYFRSGKRHREFKKMDSFV